MEKLSKKILTQIKSEKITPIPKWRFLLKDSVTYFVFILSIFLGSLGVAITMFLVENNDYLETSVYDMSLAQAMVMSVPLLWLILTLFFVFLVYYNLKHIPDGYRWTAAKSLIISILISLIVGSVLNASGVAARLNDIFAEHIPNYSRVADPRYSYWMRPELGLIAGEIVSTEGNEIEVKDLNDKLWVIDIENARIANVVDLVAGRRVRISGEITDNNVFYATQIRPWNGRMQNLHNTLQ